MAPVSTEEGVLIEVLATSHPGDWTRRVCEELGVPPHVAAPKIAAYIEQYVGAWLTYRTLYELAESQARLMAIQEQRMRQEDVARQYAAELKRTLEKPPVIRSKKKAREAMERLLGIPAEVDPAEVGNHLETLKDGAEVQGNLSFNMAKIMEQERKEAEHRAKILDRLVRELEKVPPTRLERITMAHRLAVHEGRWAESVRLLGMMPAAGTKAPSLDSMKTLASSIAARIHGGQPSSTLPTIP